MINPKRLIALARKWQKKVAATQRKRISSLITDGFVNQRGCSKSIADKGNFVVYTADGRRFMVPLAYLNSPIFQELFRISEDEFGLPCNGPITLPCDARFLQYVLSLSRGCVFSKGVEEALLASVGIARCSMTSLPHQLQTKNHMLIHGF